MRGLGAQSEAKHTSKMWLIRSSIQFHCFILKPVPLIVPQTALELNGVLNSSKKQALFHHHFLIPAKVPGLASLLFWHPVPSSFSGSG